MKIPLGIHEPPLRVCLRHHMAHILVRGLVHTRGLVLCSFADLADADAWLSPHGVQRSHARIRDHLISPRLNLPSSDTMLAFFSVRVPVMKLWSTRLL